MAKHIEVKNEFFLGTMEFKLKNTNPKLEVTCDASVSGHHVYKYVPVIRRIVGVSMCLRHFMQKFLHIPPYHVSNIVELWLDTK